MSIAVILLGILAVLVWLIIINIRIVSQSHAYIIERLGAYHSTWTVGLHIKIPFIDRIADKHCLKETLLDFPPQPVITKDNVTIMIDTIIYFQITDPKLATYGVQDYWAAVENLASTTLRNIIGSLELDETLTSRDIINGKMRSILDEATDAWGLKVNRVEVRNILPPQAIKDAMERQMKAEREKREKILQSEATRQEAILVAEGEKQAAILQATAAKESAVLRAEGEKEAQILKAQGEAEALLAIQKATAESIRLIKEAGADEAFLKLRGFEAFEKVADGKSTKIIIPSDLQNMAGLVTTFGELIKKEN